MRGADSRYVATKNRSRVDDLVRQMTQAYRSLRLPKEVCHSSPFTAPNLLLWVWWPTRTELQDTLAPINLTRG